jgi:hypothetical protein
MAPLLEGELQFKHLYETIVSKAANVNAQATARCMIGLSRFRHRKPGPRDKGLSANERRGESCGPTIP